MKKVIILLMTIMGTLQLQAQDENFWIFLCFGQSNMAGQAPIEAQDLQVSDRYLSMATTDGADRTLGQWRKAVPPLCRADAHLGPADWFGRTLLDVVPDGVRIGIVSVAVEGCPITFFDKDQNAALIAKEERDWMNGILNQYGRDPYQRLLSMAKTAAKDGVIKGILLHQGETDAYNDQWRKTLRKIYRDLQQELRFDSTAVPCSSARWCGASMVVSADMPTPPSTISRTTIPIRMSYRRRAVCPAMTTCISPARGIACWAVTMPCAIWRQRIRSWQRPASRNSPRPDWIRRASPRRA